MLYQYELHVSTPIESSSGPQDVDPNIQTLLHCGIPNTYRIKSIHYSYIYININAYCLQIRGTEIVKAVFLTGVICSYCARTSNKYCVRMTVLRLNIAINTHFWPAVRQMSKDGSFIEFR